MRAGPLTSTVGAALSNVVLSTVLLAAAALVASGCVKHVEPYKPKSRPYELPVPMDTAPSPLSTGSLWVENGPASYWSSDLRAARPNDVLTIHIDELHSASGDAETQTSRDTAHSAQIGALLGIVNAGANEDLINALTKSTFSGGGKTGRSGRVTATVPAMVRKVLPNGALYVEGHRVVLINKEEQHFYISGVVRPEDIDTSNTVRSSRLADAQIEITGRGVVSEKNSPGWLSRILDYVWPF